MNGKISKTLLPAIAMILAACLCLMSISACAPRIPAANNTDAAADIITQRYTETEINILQYTVGYKYKTLDQLTKDYRIECIRDPSVYEPEYFPYVVLLSEFGTRAFVIFDPETREIMRVMVVSNFYDHDYMEQELERAANVQPLHMYWDALSVYDCGAYTTAVRRYLHVAVTDGVFEVVISNGLNPVVQEINYYPDELIFDDVTGNPAGDCDAYLWPLLPIDKYNTWDLPLNPLTKS